MAKLQRNPAREFLEAQLREQQAKKYHEELRDNLMVALAPVMAPKDLMPRVNEIMELRRADMQRRLDKARAAKKKDGKENADSAS